MKKTYNTLTCLFGHHDYSDKVTKDKDGCGVHLCKHCKRSGYWNWSGSLEVWIDYDEHGNCVHRKWSDGLEVWTDFNKEGEIHEKWSSGDEYWFDARGDRTRCKYADS